MNSAGADIFVGVSKVIVIASLGAALVRAMRHDFSLQDTFLRVLGAFLGLFFFREYFSLLSTISNGLTSLVEKSSGAQTTARQLWDAQVQAGASHGLLNAYGQMLKFSVWGVVSSLIDLVFLLSRELLMSARDVLWQLCVVLFPLAASLAPYFPKILMNLLVYSLEIALWVPVLAVIDFVVSVVSKGHLIDQAGDSLRPDLGLPILSIQLMSIILIFSIPSTTSRIVSGAMSGDFSAGPTAMLSQVAMLKSRAVGAVRAARDFTRTQGARKNFVVAAILLLSSTSLASEQKIVLYHGFVSKIECRGRILVSSLGNETLLRLEPLPPDLGCGLILKPRSKSGTTNLIIETSTGTHRPIVEIRDNVSPSHSELLIVLEGRK